MLAPLADANTSDYKEAVVAGRDVSGKPHRSSVSALVAIVSASCRGAEYLVHGLYQRECDAACGELRRQRGAYRERRKLQVLCGRGDAGGCSVIRGDQCRACGRRCDARCLGPHPGRLVRSRLRRARSDPLRDLSAADLQQRWTLPGNGYAKIARSQVHHGRRPNRPDPDERAGGSGRGEDAGDRRAHRGRPKYDWEGLCR